MSLNRTPRCWTAALLLAAFCAQARGTTYDRTPRPALLLQHAEAFIAQDGWDSVALYRLKDGAKLFQFPAGRRVNEIDVTSDDRFLLVACADGSLGLWDLNTGGRVWWKESAQTGLGYVYDVSFAHDGRSFVASNERDFAVVCETQTGDEVRRVSFPPMQTNVMSAALSPDGSAGALIKVSERVFTFDVRTGTLADTGIRGAGWIRYSTDGKRVACRSSNSGSKEQLRVIALGAKPLAADTGDFSHIGHLRATDDGGFLACAWVEDPARTRRSVVGVRCGRGNAPTQEVWRLPNTEGLENLTDFDAGGRLGVATDFRLVTRVFNLRTGEVLLTINNSANYRPEMVSTTVHGWPASGLYVLLAAAGCVGLSWLLVAATRAAVRKH
jgi:WD40 repeat protein